MTKKLTLDAKQILVRLVAEQDSVFWPSRFDISNSVWWPHKWMALWYYRKRGLPWRSRERSAAGAKQSERSLKILTDLNLVQIFRPRTKSLQFIVTGTGDAIGRALADCNDPNASLVSVMTLYGIRKKPTWIPETELNGGAGWGDGRGPELANVAFEMLPALAAGLIEANSTVLRQVYYRLTKSGHDIATGKTKFIITDDLPEPLEDGTDYYYRTFNQALNELHAMSAQTSEIGEIPLPVSMPWSGTRKRKPK